MKYQFWCRCGAMELETKTIMFNPSMRCLLCGSAPVRMTRPIGFLKFWLIFSQHKWSTSFTLAGLGMACGAMLGMNLKMALLGLGLSLIGATLAVFKR